MEAFRTAFPTLFQLLEGTPLEDDARAAASLAHSRQDMEEALLGRIFALNELMWLLCGAVVPEWANPEAAKLERNLTSIVGAVGLTAARAAYRNKFLVEATTRIKDPSAKQQEASNSLEDVCYEIAVAGKACEVLDAGSIELEKPIPDPQKDRKIWKNSDVYGRFHGKPVRIEVTVLHETLPATVHLELDDIVRQTDISSGFSVTLKTVLTDQGYAERARALLELLHECHVSTSGKDEEIDGVVFEWRRGAYFCRQDTSPFESIVFHAVKESPGAAEIREVIHPCYVRPVTPSYVLEDEPNPPGVITLADVPGAPTQVPVSTKIGQMLDGKRQQCEHGAINIVAFGNPLPMHDREVRNAVCGPEVCMVSFWTDKYGARHSGKGVVKRNTKAPFVPSSTAQADVLTEFIEPFRRMSAVWHIRLGSHAKSEVIPNPNALTPLPQELERRLSDPTPSPESLSKVNLDDRSNSTADGNTADSDAVEQEVDIAWPAVAENYVSVCGSISEARSVLAELEQRGLTLDELQAEVRRLWSEPPKHEKVTKFVSPTNEEMAMTFVVDCAGFEQARACLEAYADEFQ